MIKVIGLIGVVLLTMYMMDSLANSQDITIDTTQSYIMADKNVLLELIKDAEKQGGELRVAAYVFNKKTGQWNKASTLCKG